MGKLYAELDERLRKFIARQPVFFVATAPGVGPDGSGGHVNVSPKGYRHTFAVLGPRTVAYLDADQNSVSIDGLPALELAQAL